MASRTQQQGVRVTLEREKNTKRYTKYNVPEDHAFAGALYLPLDEHNPATIDIVVVVPNSAS